MGTKTGRAVLYPLLRITEISSTAFAKSIQWAKAKQAAEAFRVPILMAREILTCCILKTVMSGHSIHLFILIVIWYHIHGGDMMRILVDADGCPVVDITVRLCKASGTECILLCDTAHDIRKESATTLVFDKGADSVDYALADRVSPGDLVITQDYGLASMCLARGARVLHQDGWEYTRDNIDALLTFRHEARKQRARSGRFKGPKKRGREQDAAFEATLIQILQL